MSNKRFFLSSFISLGHTLWSQFLERVVLDGGTAEQSEVVIPKLNRNTDADVVMIPSGYKATKLYSQIGTDGVDDFDVARNSIATRVNKSGLIEEVAIDVPRLDYSDGACPVLLTEPQSVNLYLNSDVLVTQGITTLASDYTVSFYGTGTVTFSGTYIGSLVGTGGRVTKTFTATAGTLTSTVSGTVTQAQIENLGYATSYIKTEGATVTRLGDVVGGAGDVNSFNSEEGVLYFEGNYKLDGLSKRIYISDGTTTNRIILTFSDTQITFEVIVNSVAQSGLAYGIITTSFNKIAIKWKLNDFALWLNGVEKLTDTNGVVFPINTLNRLDLRHISNVDFLYGKVKALKVFKTALNDTQLAQLTTTGEI